MSEETNAQDTNDGTLSGLKKTIIGTLSTLVAGGGTWLGVQIFDGKADDKESVKTEQVAPAAAAPITINVQQNQENKQKVENSGTIIKERVIEKTVPAQPEKAVKKEEESW